MSGQNALRAYSHPHGRVNNFPRAWWYIFRTLACRATFNGSEEITSKAPEGNASCQVNPQTPLSQKPEANTP
jgi:hypothetical protein